MGELNIMQEYGLNVSFDMVEPVYKQLADILELPSIRVNTTFNKEITLYPGLDSDSPDNKTIYYYCPVDDWLDGYNYLDFKSIPDSLSISESFCPVAKHKLDNFEVWQKGLKVKNTYIKGSRYKELSIDINNLDLIQFRSRYISTLKDKTIRYPNINIDHALNVQDILFSYYEVDQLYEILIATDKPICKFYCYRGHDGILGNVLLGDLLWVTQDHKEKSRHRLFVVAHQEAIRLAYGLGLDEVNFGYFLPYKNILNLSTAKHLVLESDSQCDEITHKKFLDYVNTLRQVNE